MIKAKSIEMAMSSVSS